MSMTTMSSKGQISIPTDLQRRFGWKAGDKFIVTSLDGQVTISRLPKGNVLALAGSIKLSKGYKKITDDDIENAAIAAAMERDESSRRKR